MEDRGGELTCPTTGNGISRHVRSELEAIVSGTTPEVARRPDQSFKWGVDWVCPADAEPMREVDGVLECSRCGRVIPGRLIYELVELNPH